jgi:sugar lactone lactonase YvrE
MSAKPGRDLDNGQVQRICETGHDVGVSNTALDLSAATPLVHATTPTMDLLGECPIWDDRRNGLWWLDLKGPCIRFLAGNLITAVNSSTPQHAEPTTWSAPGLVGSIALCTDGTLLLTGSGLWAFDPSAEKPFVLLSPMPEGEPLTNRFNDGRVDRTGRFVVGTMDNEEKARTGTQYRIDSMSVVGDPKLLWGNVGIPNASCFSPDGRYGYWADSWKPVLHRYETASPTDTREPFGVVEGPGGPDGACVDAQGHIWLCVWGGSKIIRYRPDGTVERIIPLPVERATCATFGGEDYGTLFVTTARNGFTEEQSAAQPLAGSVLAIETDELWGIRGLPESRLVVVRDEGPTANIELLSNRVGGF